MTDPRRIHISDYTYDLPDERIARFPLARRDASKLLVYNKGVVGEDVFSHVADYIDRDELVVMNNTRVIQARLLFRKETGALIEVFLLEPHSPADYEQMFQATGRCSWHCLIGNKKKWRRKGDHGGGKGDHSGSPLRRELIIGGRPITLEAEMEDGLGDIVALRWTAPDVSLSEIIDVAGILPIPPYLGRETEESDKETYQTVYSKIKGSVAAPTAGLHFTADVFRSMEEKGIERSELTLHVGAGTFRPVKSEEMVGHEMHTEHFSVSLATIKSLIAHGGKAVSVGTTSVRTLESLALMGLKIMRDPGIEPRRLHVGQWEPYEPDVRQTEGISSLEALTALAAYMERRGMDSLTSSTQIIIVPGYKLKVVSKLITNFHQPRSTLLLLVAAMIGDDWRKAYDYALSHSFRFLSYGDSSILIP